VRAISSTEVPGRDRLSGGAGADWLTSSRDGRTDTVHCGGGRDIVNADLADVVRTDCEVISRQLSRDLDRESDAQHETQMEPDSYSFGSTIVSVFQSGRFVDGGAATPARPSPSAIPWSPTTRPTDGGSPPPSTSAVSWSAGRAMD